MSIYVYLHQPKMIFQLFALQIYLLRPAGIMHVVLRHVLSSHITVLDINSYSASNAWHISNS